MWTLACPYRPCGGMIAITAPLGADGTQHGTCGTCGRPYTIGLRRVRQHAGPRPVYQDRDWLYQRLVGENLTLRETGDLAGVSAPTIMRWREKLGITDTEDQS